VAVETIIVAGHAVLRVFGDPREESNWVLLDYQRGEVACYVEHVRRGVELAAERAEALLVFSGGQSRREAGPRSEGLSYYHVAEYLGWFGKPEVAGRAVTEEFARDSFENLLFGICRTREWTGWYPERVRVVSWRFKQERFQAHLRAIGYPEERFVYEGVNDPPELGQALRAEAVARRKYEADPYSGQCEFREKRRERNPFRRQHGYLTSCPEVAGLLRHRGPELYAGALPWRREGGDVG
jgi:hypothetical protein